MYKVCQGQEEANAHGESRPHHFQNDIPTTYSISMINFFTSSHSLHVHICLFLLDPYSNNEFLVGCGIVAMPSGHFQFDGGPPFHGKFVLVFITK